MGKKMKMESSIDKELAKATSSSLSIGPANVYSCHESSFTLPKRLHDGFYYSSSPSPSQSPSPPPPLLPFSPIISSRDSNVLPPPALVGVPGFPEFPMFWIGEEGGRHLSPINRKQTSISKKICINKPTARRKHKFRKIQRKAVNVPYGSKGRLGQDMKRKLKEQRQERRKKLAEKIQLKRRRKKDMASICRRVAILKCT